jgi:hypothetical protein
MPLLRLHPIGFKQLLMPTLFVVLSAKPLQPEPRKCGLTVDRPFTPKDISAAGRNFMIAPVVRRGGLGVAIAPPLR